MRYRVAPNPRRVHTTWARSPAKRAKRKFANPAAIISHAVAANGSTSADFHFLASTDPNAQLKDPPNRLSDAQSCSRPSEVVFIRSGQIRTINPTIPKANPALPRPET